ncbi:unnamed protein product [Bursaphelenchus xylophilus]|uniref:(pine wood nematode) hypothetical protein n=1 Tax=Bursaphelenchus xylophilus TaxID=6326 RepID=A0A1I7RZP5_BURXY|nr:unnamed protein product [Bursaphelenchus xylophilus]CAG9111511.1 unnamed protein product [Bursaphelenchus xylophilus]
MFFFTLFLTVSTSFIKADFSETVNDINHFFSPAALDDKVMAQIGELVAKNEWQSHAKKYLESLPLYSEYAWKLQLPLQYALPYLCEPCSVSAPIIQDFLKSTGLASLAFELAICNVFLALDKSELVPVCEAFLVGLDVYSRYAPTESLCSFIPACPAKKVTKRSAPKYRSRFGDDE